MENNYWYFTTTSHWTLENIINEWPLCLTGAGRVFSESNSVSDTTFEMCGQLFSNWMTEEKESTGDQLTKLYN